MPFVRKLARELERSFVARIEVDSKITILVKGGARLANPETIKTHKKALKALKGH